MKTLKLTSILLPLMAILLLSSCKKDPLPKEVVVTNPEILPTSDIRVNKVILSNNAYFYTYSSQGFLKEASQEFINIPTISRFSILKANVTSNITTFTNPRFCNSCTNADWSKVVITINNEAVTKVNITSRYPYEVLEPAGITYSVTKTNTVNFYRNALAVDSTQTLFNGFNFYNAGDFKILESNATGLPTKILKVNPYSVDETGAFIPNTKILEVTYTPAPSIPNKLKRMVNESILSLSRFGYASDLSQINFSPIGGKIYPSRIDGYGGDESFIIFGLHRAYTLQKTSTEMVASIKETTYYGNGAPVVKTTNYPYTHNPATRNLVVGGLSIFYDVVAQQ